MQNLKPGPGWRSCDVPIQTGRRGDTWVHVHTHGLPVQGLWWERALRRAREAQDLQLQTGRASGSHSSCGGKEVPATRGRAQKGNVSKRGRAWDPSRFGRIQLLRAPVPCPGIPRNLLGCLLEPFPPLPQTQLVLKGGALPTPRAGWGQPTGKRRW